jgi:hypothetical protein
MTPRPTYAEQLEAVRRHLVDVLAGAPADPDQLRGLRCAVGILRRLAERQEERQAPRCGAPGVEGAEPLPAERGGAAGGTPPASTSRRDDEVDPPPGRP